MIKNKINVTVLVTGVGAIIGQGIIKSLRKSNYLVKIVGIDRSKNSRDHHFVTFFIKNRYVTKIQMSTFRFGVMFCKKRV